MQTKTIIRPTKGVFSFDQIKELWEYRELFYIFVWKNIKVRYKQTILGIFWVLFQPLVTVTIFSIFFGKIAKIPSGDLPYPLFSYIGLIVWNFFSGSLLNASNSIVNMGGMIQKIYFPRIIIPLSAILTSAIDFVISLIPYIILMIYYHIQPSPFIIIYLPIVFLIVFLSASGLGFFAASLNVRYRDVSYLLPFFVQIGLFLTPVIYSLDIIYDYRKWFLILNPLTGIIETFRHLSVMGTRFDIWLLTSSFIISIIIFLIGLYYFNKTERTFADIV